MPSGPRCRSVGAISQRAAGNRQAVRVTGNSFGIYLVSRPGAAIRAMATGSGPHRCASIRRKRARRMAGRKIQRTWIGSDSHRRSRQRLRHSQRLRTRLRHAERPPGHGFSRRHAAECSPAGQPLVWARSFRQRSRRDRDARHRSPCCRQLASAMRCPFLFIGNVGEEGEGDLRGMRHIFSSPRWKDSIHYSLVLDGAGSDTIVAEALGSRRFEVIVRGPGGHSWSDFGAPNPIVVLARAVQSFAQTPVPASPKTTFNVGVIRGGTSVNSIPESASMRVDIRSTSMAEMERLERALRHALDQAIEEESQATEARPARRRPFGLSREVGGDWQSSRRRTPPQRPHPASDSRGGRATGKRRPGSACLHRCQHPAVSGTRSHRHRWRRSRRRSAYFAGMV